MLLAVFIVAAFALLGAGAVVVFQANRELSRRLERMKTSPLLSAGPRLNAAMTRIETDFTEISALVQRARAAIVPIVRLSVLAIRVARAVRALR